MIFGGYEVAERWLILPHAGASAMHAIHIVRGLLGAVAVGAVVAYQLSRRVVPVYPQERGTEGLPSILDSEERMRQHGRWFIHSRSIASVVALAFIVIAVPIADILPREALAPLLSWWAALVASNALFALWAAHASDFGRQLLVQALSDLVVLTGLLHASGGIENPLVILYLVHAIIAGILLPRRQALAVAAAASALFVTMAIGELGGVLPHRAAFCSQKAGRGSDRAIPASLRRGC